MRHLVARTFVYGAFALALGSCGPDEAGRWIEEAHASSEAAAAAERAGDLEAEQAALEQIVASEPPSGVAPDDARIVRQDAYERLAHVFERRGDAQSALRQIELGLDLGESQDIFTANLLVRRGRILEMRGLDLDAAGAYHEALMIHEALLEAALHPAAEGDHR